MSLPVLARSSGAGVPAGRQGSAGIAAGVAGGAPERGGSAVGAWAASVFREGGGLGRRLVVPGASGVLQRPHRSDGVMRAVDCCIVRALGTQQTHLLLHLRVLALLFISCDLEELVSYK